LAHIATFETLVFRFQALLQIQRLLLIPTCFAPAAPQNKAMFQNVHEAMFEALVADFDVVHNVIYSYADV
jgi:hypothetical protein